MTSRRSPLAPPGTGEKVRELCGTPYRFRRLLLGSSRDGDISRAPRCAANLWTFYRRHPETGYVPWSQPIYITPIHDYRQLITLLSSPSSSPIPYVPCHPGLVDHLPGVRLTQSCPTEVGDRRWLEGCVLISSCTGRLPLTVKVVHPGDVRFSQDHCHPLPYIP